MPEFTDIQDRKDKKFVLCRGTICSFIKKTNPNNNQDLHSV